MVMGTDPAEGFLAALQLADSALPIGRFTQSLGLESVVAAEPRIDAIDLEDFVAGYVACGVAPLDGVAVALAHQAYGAGDVGALLVVDRALEVRKLAASSRKASSACGRRLAVLSSELTADPTVAAMAAAVRSTQTPGHLAAVEGVLAAACGLGAREAVLVELRGAATTLLSAAVRLGRLSPFVATGILRRLAAVLGDAADEALARDIEGMTSSALEAEVHALVHGRSEAHLFAS